MLLEPPTAADLDRIFDHVRTAVRHDMQDTVRKHMDYFLRDNSDKSPDELQEIAAILSPGGAHDSGWLIRNVMAAGAGWWADETLIAALLCYNWKGGKMGFQFLSSPHRTPLSEYQEEAAILDGWFEGINPLAVLTGEDRDFYNALPERFTVYRGGALCSPDAIAAGLCWTTSRPVAEWFANRATNSKEDTPILVSARIWKGQARLAFDSEFEVVTLPYRWRQLKCPKRSIDKWRPPMGKADQRHREWQASIRNKAASTTPDTEAA